VASTLEHLKGINTTQECNLDIQDMANNSAIKQKMKTEPLMMYCHPSFMLAIQPPPMYMPSCQYISNLHTYTNTVRVQMLNNVIRTETNRYWPTGNNEVLPLDKAIPPTIWTDLRTSVLFPFPVSVENTDYLPKQRTNELCRYVSFV
jgi:hypothetical protein